MSLVRTGSICCEGMKSLPNDRPVRPSATTTVRLWSHVCPFQASSLFIWNQPQTPTPHFPERRSLCHWLSTQLLLPGQRTQPPILPSNPLRVIVLFDDHFCTSVWRLTRRSGRRGYLEGMSAPCGSAVLRACSPQRCFTEAPWFPWFSVKCVAC